jgi:uncharacterized membrane protein
MSVSVRNSSAIAAIALGALACSNTTEPLARPLGADRAITAASIPYATGVHTAAIPLPANCGGGPLNAFAEVVGTCTPDSGNIYAFKWEIARGFHALTLPGDTLSAYARGVNDKGEVLIESFGGAGTTVGIWGWFGDVRWLRPLSTYVPGGCAPQAINDASEVIGNCFVGINDYPTVWTPYGTPDGLHPGGGAALVTGIAFGLSNAGYIVGGYGPGVSAWLFTPERALVILAADQTTGVYGMVATSVNNGGQAVGFAESADPNCGSRAVVWLRTDSITDLGVCGQATAITDDGIVVGTGQPYGGEPLDSTFAFVWTATGGMQLLPNLFGHTVRQNSSAGAINSKYQIVGGIKTGTGLASPSYTMMWTLPTGAAMQATVR